MLGAQEPGEAVTNFGTFWSAIITTAPILALAVLLEGRWTILRERERTAPSLGNLRAIALTHGITILALGWSTLNATFALALDTDSPFLRGGAAVSVALAVGVLISAPAGPFLTLGLAGVRPAIAVMRIRVASRIQFWRWRRRLRRLDRRQNRLWRRFASLAERRRSGPLRRLKRRARRAWRQVSGKDGAISSSAVTMSQEEFDAWARSELMDSYRQFDVDAANIHYLRADMDRAAERRRKADREFLRKAIERESKRLARFVDEPPEVWLSAHSVEHSGDQSRGSGGQR